MPPPCRRWRSWLWPLAAPSLPTKAALDLSGLSLTDADLDILLDVDADVWTEEAALIPAFYEKFGDRLPKALWGQHAALTKRLEEARAAKLAAE